MTPANLTTNWTSLFEVWQKFIADYPQLAIPGQSIKAGQRFARIYQAQLMKCGAIAKTSNKRWLAHRDFFPVAAFACWIGRDPAEAVAEQRAVMAAMGAMPEPVRAPPALKRHHRVRETSV